MRPLTSAQKVPLAVPGQGGPVSCQCFRRRHWHWHTQVGSSIIVVVVVVLVRVVLLHYDDTDTVVRASETLNVTVVAQLPVCSLPALVPLLPAKIRAQQEREFASVSGPLQQQLGLALAA